MSRIGQLFSVFSEDGGPDWQGYILEPKERGGRFYLELARPNPPWEAAKNRVALGTNPAPYGMDGMLGLQHRATLLNCRLVYSDQFGAAGTGVDQQRAVMGFEFDCIVKGALSSDNEFYKMAGQFDGLATVLRHRFRLEWKPREEGDGFVFGFCTPNKRTVTCSEVISHSSSAESKGAKGTLQLTFELPEQKFSSLSAFNLSAACEDLFSILGGQRFKAHDVTLLLKDKPFGSPHLQIAGKKWSSERQSVVSFVNCDEFSISGVLLNFLGEEFEIFRHEAEVLSRILFNTEFLEDKLFWILPVLERQLKRRFRNITETNFEHAQEVFFNYIENSGDEEVRGFARKHVTIQASKARGLKQWAEDAVKLCVGRGIIVDKEFPSKLSKIRAKLMHDSINAVSNSADLDDFYLEALFVSLFLFFDELGLLTSEMEDFLVAFGKLEVNDE